MPDAAAAIAGSVVLALVHLLTPRLARLAPARLTALASFSGGAGLAYVFLYLLYELVRFGAPKIHRLLPLTPAPLETLFLFLLCAVAGLYLVQVTLESTPDKRDDYVGTALLFVAYNFLTGAGLVEEAHGGALNLAFYVTAIGLHLLFNDQFLLHLGGAVRERWRQALAVAPVAGCVLAVGGAVGDGLLYLALAVIAGSTVINVVRHELPGPRRLRPGFFVAGVLVYAGLIFGTWRF